MTIRSFVLCFSLVSLNASMVLANHLQLSQINSCVTSCVGEVFNGRRELTECVSLPLVTRQIIGPAARGKEDSAFAPVTAVVLAVLNEQIDYYAREFASSSIKIEYFEESPRQPHVYGVEGTFRQATGSPYQFSANGQFQSESNCQLYTLAVGPVSVNRWLREQPAVDEIIEETIRSWGY